MAVTFIIYSISKGVPKNHVIVRFRVQIHWFLTIHLSLLIQVILLAIDPGIAYRYNLVLCNL